MEITCFDCKYHREIGNRHLCYGQKGAPEINPSIGCEDWKHEVRAKWELTGVFNDFAQCSNCGYTFPLRIAITQFNFCPNCGREMRKER